MYECDFQLMSGKESFRNNEVETQIMYKLDIIVH